MKRFKNLKYSVILIGLSSLLFSCKSAVLKDIHEAKDNIENRPDSALAVLNRLKDSYREMTDKEKACFGLYYIMALDHNGNEMNPVSYIDYSAGYFTKYGKTEELAHCFLYKARIFWYGNSNYDKAVKLLLTAAEMAEQIRNPKLWGKIHFDLGVLYASQNLTEKALFFYDEALTGFEKAGNSDNIAKTYTVIGKLHIENEKYPLALENFNKALPLAKDSVTLGDVFSQLANYSYEIADLDSAYYYIRKSLSFPAYPQNLSNRNFLLADIYFDRERYDSAVHYTNIALKYKINIHTERECYRLLANVASIEGDEKLFDFYLDKYHNCQDSILLNNATQNIPAIEKLLHTENKVRETKKSLHRVLLLSSVLISGILLLYLYYGKLIRLWKGKAVKEKQNNLRQQLLWNLKEAEIRLSAEKKILGAGTSTRHLKKIYGNLLPFSNKEKLVEKMDELFNGAGTIITQTYPAVNDKELKYIFMFLLDVPVNDICFMLNYQKESLRKMRYRLAPKLNLQGAGELNRFLETFL
jgi:tetratricopeptide (TPR) repeat protein